MIQCPDCKHKEMVGALFCSKCGTQLILSSNQAFLQTTAQTMASDILGSCVLPPYPSSPENSFENLPEKALEDSMSLSIMDTGEVLPLMKRGEITLGRVSEGQSIIPDIDLSPYRAYEAGVSRLHATIKIVDQQTTIVDLGSANGTRVNGEKLPPLRPHPIGHGDILTLGRFNIQILIRS